MYSLGLNRPESQKSTSNISFDKEKYLWVTERGIAEQRKAPWFESPQFFNRPPRIRQAMLSAYRVPATVLTHLNPIQAFPVRCYCYHAGFKMTQTWTRRSR